MDIVQFLIGFVIGFFVFVVGVGYLIRYMQGDNK